MVNTKLDIHICGPLGLPIWPTSNYDEFNLDQKHVQNIQQPQEGLAWFAFWIILMTLPASIILVATIVVPIYIYQYTWYSTWTGKKHVEGRRQGDFMDTSLVSCVAELPIIKHIRKLQLYIMIARVCH